MTLPNFLVIGSTRSGTTSLHHYLGQHPQVFICPINETNFFTLDRDLPATDDPYLERSRRQGIAHRPASHSLRLLPATSMNLPALEGRNTTPRERGLALTRRVS